MMHVEASPSGSRSDPCAPANTTGEYSSYGGTEGVRPRCHKTFALLSLVWPIRHRLAWQGQSASRTTTTGQCALVTQC